jgi:spermidine/putrescine transport system ATP-binding protein
MTGSAVPAIEFRGINKSFGRVHVVKDLDLQIHEGEFFSLLGPSGCGKTTSLRMMAGFEEPDTGQILLRGTDVTDVPPNRRNVNLVFQNYELFPHMTVFDNVAYGLKLKRVPGPELRSRVDEMLAVVQVQGLEHRGARQLSGGQQQRVALARALVNRPAVLLLDEPLSALDVKLRRQMQVELKAIQHRLGTTFVYVTHDQEEAFLMSDRVAIMNHGRILQLDTPRLIYDRPADAFVADFVGSLNAFEMRVDEVAGDTATMRIGEGDVVHARLDGASPAIGTTIPVGLRPERIRLTAGAAGGGSAAGGAGPGSAGSGIATPVEADASRLSGAIGATDYVGSVTTYRVTTALGVISCQQPNDTASAVLEPGRRVVLQWARDAAFAMPERAAR